MPIPDDTVSIDAIIQAIHDILEAGHRFQIEESLVRAVCTKTGVDYRTESYRVEFPLWHLIKSGQIGGVIDEETMECSNFHCIPAEERSGGEHIKKSLEEARAALVIALQKATDSRLEIISLTKRLAEKPKDRIVEVKRVVGKKVVKRVKGIFHPEFERVLDLAKARKNIFLYGPTGSGKTHICSQVADALGLDFSFISCTSGMSEGNLTGRLLPIGVGGRFEYVTAEFVERFEKGGIFLWDEYDASDANVQLITNTAISNDVLYLPNRRKKPYAKRHPDFVAIAAANTFGTGADRMYTGRNKLDAATLDRFGIGKVIIDYDASIEEQLCPDQELRELLLSYRRGIIDHALERCLSTRFMRDAYDLKQVGWPIEKIEATLFAGWRIDEINKIKAYTANERFKSDVGSGLKVAESVPKFATKGSRFFSKMK